MIFKTRTIPLGNIAIFTSSLAYFARTARPARTGFAQALLPNCSIHTISRVNAQRSELRSHLDVLPIVACNSGRSVLQLCANQWLVGDVLHMSGCAAQAGRQTPPFFPSRPGAATAEYAAQTTGTVLMYM